MKIDLNLEPKDYVKIALLIGAGALSMSKGGDKSGERMAVLETKMEVMGKDVTDIKNLLLRRRP